MKLSELLSVSEIGYDSKKISDCEIGYIETNTQSAVENCEKMPLFVCIDGTNYNSHVDIARLIKCGIRAFVTNENAKIYCSGKNINIIKVKDTRKALALLARSFYGFPDRELFTVGITGTKGKTTVTYMLRAVFEAFGKKCGIIGTNGIIYGGNTYECDNSTPGSLEYYGALRQMADDGVSCVFCEVTSQALMQYRTFGTVFDVAVFTNLFPDHIGKNEHFDFDEYKSCKGYLFSQCKKAVLNTDSEHSEYFQNICRENGVEYICFSAERDADIFCRDITVLDTGSEFSVGESRFAIPLPGVFNVSNALCTVSVARLCKVPDEIIARGLSGVCVYGRCERVPNPDGVNIIIDYAHNKESLGNILEALKQSCRGKLYCVFGAGGDRSRLRRAGMGQAAAKYADVIIVTSDNPRSESREQIIADILPGLIDAKGECVTIPDRRKAIYYALGRASLNDTVLLAGKGGQTFEEVCGVKYPFDERKVVEDFYRERVTPQ